MTVRIPIKAARAVADDYSQRQVILVTWDGERTHVVTYGRSVEECDQAAQGGNRIKAALGWPESLQAEPSRVRRLRDELADARAEIAMLKNELQTLENKEERR